MQDSRNDWGISTNKERIHAQIQKHVQIQKHEKIRKHEQVHKHEQVRNHKRLLKLICLMLLILGMLQAKDVDKLEASERKRGYAELPESKLFSKSESYPTIQPLIDAVPPGGKLQLPVGEFAGPLVVDKPIIITGHGDDTILHISVEEQVISLQSDRTTLSQFSIVDKREAPQAPVISSEGYSEVVIRDLNIKTASTAIQLRNMKQTTLQGNKVSWGGQSYIKRTSRGNGIYLYSSSDILLKDNEIFAVYDGIYVENSEGLTIQGNKIYDSRYSFHLMYSERIELAENESYDSVTGMMVMTSAEVIIRNNRLYQHQGNANAAAVLIYDVETAQVDNNHIAENRIGISIERSQSTQVESNMLLHNFVGLQLQRAEDMELERNNFIGNVTNVWDDGSSKPSIQHNYWDSLQGLDMDGDGYSELTYKSSPFFLALIERRPSFQLLFGTTGIAFIEQLYEAEAKQWISDASPSMTQYTIGNELASPWVGGMDDRGNRKEQSDIQWAMLIMWFVLCAGGVYLMIKVRRFEQ